MYWGNFTHVPAITETMLLNRFDEILSILHFNDNCKAVPANTPGHNKLHDIQPLIDHFRAVFKYLVEPETCKAVGRNNDFFQRSSQYQDLHAKEASEKWGYKLWCRARVSSYVYDFKVVGGNGAKGPPPNMKSNLTFGESEYVFYA